MRIIEFEHGSASCCIDGEVIKDQVTMTLAGVDEAMALYILGLAMNDLDVELIEKGEENE